MGLPMTMPPLRVAVLASGRGTNLQALLSAQVEAKLTIDIVAVGSDRPQAMALHYAKAAGIPAVILRPITYATRKEFDQALFDQLAVFKPELIVLAGFMRILDQDIVSRWYGKLINIHPSLLPKYPGLKTHQRVLANGDIKHGASVHFVTSELDGGPVISYTEIKVLPDDDPERLAARLLPQEHRLLTATVKLFADRRILLKSETVYVDNAPLSQPLHLNENDQLS